MRQRDAGVQDQGDTQTPSRMCLECLWGRAWCQIIPCHQQAKGSRKFPPVQAKQHEVQTSHRARAHLCVCAVLLQRVLAILLAVKPPKVAGPERLQPPKLFDIREDLLPQFVCKRRCLPLTLSNTTQERKTKHLHRLLKPVLVSCFCNFLLNFSHAACLVSESPISSPPSVHRLCSSPATCCAARAGKSSKARKRHLGVRRALQDWNR